MRRFNVVVCAWALMGGVALVQAQQKSIDLTAENVAVRGSAQATIIDTATVQPQIQASFPWTGPISRVRDHLPGHVSPQPGEFAQEDGVGTAPPAGGLVAEPRATVDSLFPGISQTPWTPPDPTIAVGPNHIVETVNMALAFYTKSGQLLFSQNLDSTGNPGFFEDVGGGNFTFDPKCFYDHYAGRFVVLALEVYGSSQSWISIAVSDDGDPNGVWYKYRTNSVVRVGNSTYWVDYPGFGYDQQGYYVTGNLFPLSGGGFGGVLFRAFDKASMLNGGQVDFNDVRDGGAASVQAGQHHSQVSTPFFVQVNSTNSIRLTAMRDPLGSPSLTGANVSVPGFNYPGDAPHQGGGSIDTLDGRIINVTFRDGRLYAGHGVAISGRAQARWYEFAVNNWPDSGSPSLTQSGNVDGGSGLHTFFPALVENACGDVGMVVAKSGSSQYAGVEVTGRRSSDPPGSMGALTQMNIGNSGYNGGRWGDYFDIALDPTDDRTFWVVGEYSQNGVWATGINSFTICEPGGGDICDDIKKFAAKCKNGTVKPKLVFVNTNYDGRDVSFAIDGDLTTTQVSGKKAKASVCCYAGAVTVDLVDPRGCEDALTVTCD